MLMKPYDVGTAHVSPAEQSDHTHVRPDQNGAKKARFGRFMAPSPRQPCCVFAWLQMPLDTMVNHSSWPFQKRCLLCDPLAKHTHNRSYDSERHHLIRVSQRIVQISSHSNRKETVNNRKVFCCHRCIGIGIGTTLIPHRGLSIKTH